MSKATTFEQLRALAAASESYTADVAAAAAGAIEAVDDEIGNVVAAAEESGTATAAHAVGSHVRYNGHMYKVTRAIAIGDTISPGTNVTETSVAGELELLTDAVTGVSYSAATETVTIPTLLGSYAGETITFS